ncbi:MAG: type I-E CRISPR-associated protein Cas7/Cse4/CasC [Saccharospirillaceae bacterium]|nr:type I-E CRISPR-associated protein Cas7/Cse4/CasC [Saccharospirillaceae bacterium]MCD8531793.1 type I-E CRISPR-associated protein Cas7/Cse4/CasC [Saccharospirillaceae bacterium]
MTNFVNFHVLISHSPACLNRDDMNMQKDAVFGGKRRVRISSQSLKRAIRKSDYYASHIGDPSIRTRKLDLLVEEFCRRMEVDSEEEKAWVTKAVQIFLAQSPAASDDDEDDGENDSESESGPSAKAKKVAVAPWSVGEFNFILTLIKDVYEKPLNEKEAEKLEKELAKEHSRKATAKKPKKSDQEVKDAFMLTLIKKEVSGQMDILKKSCADAVDIALSGRMATSGLMTTIDGAMSIAHAITTHTVDSDIDWFTAVDDLDPLGSGHLDTQEFSAGVFYRYASLNISQLQENLGGVGREKALEIAAHLAHMLATETPNAKQRTFAAFNPADLVMVNFTDVPVSLANAFESPVKARQEGYLKPSVEALSAYWNRVAVGYGLTGAAAQFSLADEEAPEGVQPLKTLADLKNWIKNNGEG